MKHLKNQEYAISFYVSVCVYALFAAYFTFAYRGDSYASRNLSNIVLLPGLAAIFWAYFKAHRILLQTRTLDARVVFGTGIVLALVAFCIPPFYSTDLYSYVNGGWQQARYNINPYTLMIVATPGFGTDPMLSTFWSLNPFPYGFLFAAIAKALCQMSGGNITVALALFKLLAVAAYFATAGLVYHGSKLLGSKCPQANLHLFLWSPIILIHTVSHGHNDILMILAVMAAFYCLAKKRIAAVIPLLVSAALLKLLWIFALPPAIIFMLKKHGLKATLNSAFLGAVTFALISLPYLKDWRSFQLQEINKNISVHANSLAATIEHLRCGITNIFYHRHEPGWLQPQLTAIANSCELFLLSILFILFAILMKQLLQKESPISLQRLLHSLVFIALFAVCFASGKFYPWYIAMFFPLALWLPERDPVRKLAMILSCTQVLAITCIGHDHINNFVLLTLIPTLSFVIINKRIRQPAQSAILDACSAPACSHFSCSVACSANGCT